MVYAESADYSGCHIDGNICVYELAETQELHASGRDGSYAYLGKYSIITNSKEVNLFVVCDNAVVVGTNIKATNGINGQLVDVSNSASYWNSHNSAD